MKKSFCLLSIIYFVIYFGYSQEITSNLIKTISFKKAGDNYSSNLIIAGLNERFSISFDVLSGIEYDLYYTIEHCDYDWKKSKLLKSEYLRGFEEVKIENYSSSFNTYQIYTHYNISFPNYNTKLLKSGNYILKILDEYGVELFRRKFILHEKLVSVQTQIKRSRDLKYINEKQVVNFEVNPINIQLNNPDKTVRVLIFKNKNLENSRVDLKPKYKLGQKLVYNFDKELSFWGGNEYLYFDNKFVRNTNVNVRGYSLGEIYTNFLFSDISRRFKKYTYNPDINGGFVIDAANARDTETEADYVYVNFTLDNQNNYIENNSKVYIVGDFNNHLIDDEFKMNFNRNENKFEAKILLKQGFYNYRYVLLNDENQIIYGGIDGNFDETENEYNVIIYYRNFGERYDRVIGVGKGLSQYIIN